MNKNKWLKVAILVVMVIILIYLAYSCGSGKSVTPGSVDKKPIFNIGADKNAEVGKAEERSKEEIVAELNKKVEESMINISMNMNPVFENGSSEGNLLIVNEEMNNYMQVIEIYIDETNELIYTSGGIPVGSRVDSAKLDVVLSKGDYTCTAYFNAVNKDTGESIGKAGARIKITIQN